MINAPRGSDLAPTRASGGGDALSSEPLPKSFARAMNAATVRAEFRAKRKLRGEDGDRYGEAGDGDGPKKKGAKRRKLEGGEAQIRPGETLAHFNKRVETDMRPLVRTAVQASLATTRAERKKSESDPKSKSTPGKGASSEATTSTKSNSTSTKASSKTTGKTKSTRTQEGDEDEEPVDKHAGRPKEFARTSSAAPRRLNDIALAPPDLTSSAMARRAAKTAGGTAKNGTSTKHSNKTTSVLTPAQQVQMEAAREAAVARYREMKAAKRAAGGGGWGDGGDGERGGGAVGEGEE
ncbi:hypothetical protein C8R43DRAFT_39338 [Mycena crocata]|nr:hypothetical protein C8R43DRAFT_39338 [Mycena crocata]